MTFTVGWQKIGGACDETDNLEQKFARQIK
jgi:hypothetical protein